MSFEADGSIVSGQLRTAALAVAAFDLLRTIPAEYRLYKSADLLQKVLLAAVRYLGIAALISNAALYYSGFSEESCRRVHLLPGIIQLFLGLAVQAILFYRTFTISKYSRTVLAILIFASIVSIPLEALAVGFGRQPVTFTNDLTKKYGCLSLVHPGAFNAGPVLYLAGFCFDAIAISLSIYHIKRSSTDDIMYKLLHNGVFLMVIDGVMNLFTFLASVGVPGIEHLGSIVSVATGFMVAQHILFLTNSPNYCGMEYKHEAVTLSKEAYKSSGARSTGSLPVFSFPSKDRPITPYSRMSTPPNRRSTQSIDRVNRNSLLANGGSTATTMGGNNDTIRAKHASGGSISALHLCHGREALKYRVDGDVNMFQSQSKVSLALTRPSFNEETRRVSISSNITNATGPTNPSNPPNPSNLRRVSYAAPSLGPSLRPVSTASTQLEKEDL